MKIVIRKAANETETEWLEDDDRYFRDEWEESLQIVVPHGSTERNLIAEVEGELCAIRIVTPHIVTDDGSLAEMVEKAILGAR